MSSLQYFKKHFLHFCFLFALASPHILCAGERLLIQLKDFTQVEMKSGGFVIPSNTRLHIYSLGGGEKNNPFSNIGMYAYGWIINADTRELAWQMDRNNTIRDGNYRKFDDEVTLTKGSYEVYFAAYGFASQSWLSNFNFNIDRRRDKTPDGKIQQRGFLDWIEQMFGEDYKKDWKQLAKNWEISLYVDESVKDVSMFNPPKEFSNIVYQKIRLGENEHIRQRFSISKSMPLRIYALGEKDYQDELADYGWIINLKTHKRIWEMREGNLQHAGGADKNIKFDNVVPFPEGDFILYFNTDGSHSFVDWNAPPPSDPFNYGITLIATDERNQENFKLVSTGTEEQNVIVQLTKVGDNETRNASFTLKEETPLRIYAIGERSYSLKQMADYGWIINAKTREKVWTMDPERTEHAGGAEKNRIIDEVITLPKGTYTVFFQTDDSHSYGDWNSSPPFDPEHWGITVYGEGDNFNMNNVEKNVTPHQSGVIAQIIQVGNNANKTHSFTLDKTTRVRIYALGEGQNREMYDYGWIENVKTNEVIWEMTYSMTFHAGGSRKNRIVSTTILLDKGDYMLHYVSDDSHSFNHWNADPPDDQMMWGITLYEEK